MASSTPFYANALRMLLAAVLCSSLSCTYYSNVFHGLRAAQIDSVVVIRHSDSLAFRDTTVIADTAALSLLIRAGKTYRAFDIDTSFAAQYHVTVEAGPRRYHYRMVNNAAERMAGDECEQLFCSKTYSLRDILDSVVSSIHGQ